MDYCHGTQLGLTALGAAGVQLQCAYPEGLGDPRASICWSCVQLAGMCLGFSLVWLLEGPGRWWLAPTAAPLLQGCLIGSTLLLLL